MDSVNIIFGEGFWFNKQEERLEKVVTNKIIIDLKDMSVNYILKSNNRETEVKSDDFLLYPSVPDFECGNDIKSRGLNIDEIYEKTYGGKCAVYEDEETDEFTIKAWMFDKEPVYKVIPKIKLIMELKEGANPRWFSSYRLTPDKEMSIYTSRKDAINSNVYRELNDDGTITEHIGYGTRLRLNSEQEKLLNEFKEVYKRLKKAGVEFVFNRDELTLHAYNNKDIYTVICDEPEEEYKDKVKPMLPYLSRGLDFHIDDFYEGNVYAIFKEDE